MTMAYVLCLRKGMASYFVINWAFSLMQRHGMRFGKVILVEFQLQARNDLTQVYGITTEDGDDCL